MVAGRRLEARWLALVFLGGAVGTTLRSAIQAASGTAPGQLPLATLGINLGGSLLLGALLEGIARSGPDAGWRRGLRLGAGTGVLGGFTTYSAFSVETVLLARAGAWPVAAGYALTSVVGGILAAVLGVRLVRFAAPGRRHPATGGNR